MADIAYIPIRQLHPHPDNPRKELGDLSELAASIKENGVYQNLTVIPGHYLGKQEYIARCIADGGDVSAAEAAWTPKAVWSSEDYTIIIGHRRAAASRKRQRQAPLRGQSLSVSSGKKSTRARPTVSCACVARNAATYLAASCGNPAPA